MVGLYLLKELVKSLNSSESFSILSSLNREIENNHENTILQHWAVVDLLFQPRDIKNKFPNLFPPNNLYSSDLMSDRLAAYNG